jgi:hypothetical protein
MSRAISTTLAVSVLIMACLAQARADSINLSTGLDALGNLQTADGAVDANWSVVGGGAAYVVASNDPNWYSGWAPNGSGSTNGQGSDWIAKTTGQENPGPAPYSFSTTFSLAGYNLATVSLTGTWCIDDDGTVFLNGTPVSVGGEGFDNYTTTTLLGTVDVLAGSGLFNQESNVLTIEMQSNDQSRDGVRFDGSVQGELSAVPSPTPLVSMASLLPVVAGMVFLRRRRAMA